jgi:hypothetical protein
MLGRKNYEPEELDAAKTMVDAHVARFRALRKAVAAGGDKKATAAVDALEPALGNDLAMMLDRFFVHRIRGVTGKANTPLNELELVTESLMLHGGRFRTNKVLKYSAADSVLGLEPGDEIALSVDDVARLADAVFAELNDKFL